MRFPNPALLGLLGLLGSLLWLGLNTFLSPDWGLPGSANYLGYQTISRLWAPAFAGMLCGYMGLCDRFPLRVARLGRVGCRLAVTGLVVMMAGNIAEFWFFTELPYGEINARSLAWISVLLAMLCLALGVTWLGVAGLRQHSLPAWGSAVLVLALPIFVGTFLARFYQGAWLVLAVLGLTAGALAAWPALAAAARKEAA